MKPISSTPVIDPFTRTRFHAELRLETWFPEGVLDVALATFMVHYVGFEESVADHPFNRFSDLTGLTAIHLDFKEISDLVAMRRTSYDDGPPVRSAILATSASAYGVARMFAALMELSPIDVRVFRRVEEAADWLEAPVGKLAKDLG
jgi:hypothetical protein